MATMNPLEHEMLKYEKKGFKKEQKKTMKSSTRMLLVNKKGFSGWDEGLLIYYVDGNPTTDGIRESLKDYERFRDNEDCSNKRSVSLYW